MRLNTKLCETSELQFDFKYVDKIFSKAKRWIVRPSAPLINPLNAELNPIHHLLASVGARHIVHISRIRVNGCRGSFLGVKAVGLEANHLPISGAKVRKSGSSFCP